MGDRGISNQGDDHDESEVNIDGSSHDGKLLDESENK